MAQVTVVASATQTGTGFAAGFSMVVSVPTGTADGDLMIAHVQTSSNSYTVATPTGWTLKDSDTTNSGASYLFHRIASSEPASYTFVVSGASGNKSGAVGIITLRSQDSTNYFNVYTKTVDTTSDTTANGSAITPTASPEGILVAFTGTAQVISITHSGHAIANNNPTWTEQWDVNASAGAPGYVSIACATGLYPYLTTTGGYTDTLSASTVSTTYFVFIQTSFNFSGQFSATGTFSGSESLAVSFPGAFESTGTLSATVATGVAKFTNLIKSATTWLNQNKS